MPKPLPVFATIFAVACSYDQHPFVKDFYSGIIKAEAERPVKENASNC